jgi:hypothetical protein
MKRDEKDTEDERICGGKRGTSVQFNNRDGSRSVLIAFAFPGTGNPKRIKALASAKRKHMRRQNRTKSR